MTPENPTIPVFSVVVCPFCAAKDAEIARLKAALDRTCCADHQETRKRLEIAEAALQEVLHICEMANYPEVIGADVRIDVIAKRLRAALAEGKE